MAATLRDNFTGTGALGSTLLNDADDWGGQSFTTSVAYNLSRIDLHLARGVNGSTHEVGTIIVGLYAVEASGHPAGSSLASGTIASDSIPATGSAAFVTCILSSAYILSNNTKYCIVVHGTSLDATHKLYWSTDDDGAGASDFAGGDLEWSTTGGVPGGWATTTTTDFLFKCWGDVAPPSDKTYTKRLIAIGNHEIWHLSPRD